MYAIPTLRGRSLRVQQSLAGRQNGKPGWVPSRPRLAMPYSPPASRSANRSAASKRRSAPFRYGLLAGSDPIAAGRMGLSGSILPVPIEACRNGGSLPATYKQRGSAPTLRRPWLNRKRASGL